MTIVVAKADGSGNATVKTLDDVVGTAGSANASVLSIQGIASGTTLHTTLDAGTAIAGKFGIDQTTKGTTNGVCVVDPTSGNAALVTLFHNADNQSLGTAYGIMTGGVDQLVNGSGNLDRKRGVSGDAMAVTGLAAEVPMVFNGTSYDRLRSVAGDGVSSTGLVQEALALYNGSTYDRATGSAARGLDVAVKPSATAVAPSLSRIKAASSTNATSVKASAGNVYRIIVGNTTASARYLKLYNKASAPTVGTDTPLFTIYIAPNSAMNYVSDIPINFTTGIAYAITGGVADTDTTAVTADDVHGALLYV